MKNQNEFWTVVVPAWAMFVLVIVGITFMAMNTGCTAKSDLPQTRIEMKQFLGQTMMEAMEQYRVQFIEQKRAEFEKKRKATGPFKQPT